MLSKRATIEKSKQGIGISAGARKYMRKAMPEYAKTPNSELNEIIVSDFLKSRPWHRFKLSKSFQGVAEVRKSNSFAYIALLSGRGTHEYGYDIIAIQPTIKEPTEKVREIRMKPGWGYEY